MSQQQVMEALAKANDVRLRRYRQKRHLRELPAASGRAVVAAIISSPGELWQTATLDYVLRMPFRAGPGFSSRIRKDLSPKKQLGTLTQRQRDLLVDRIDQVGRKQ